MGSSFRRGNARTGLISEINVTPLVDVMLVLLIIFMVTAPMMVSGVSVDLPETMSGPLTSQEEPLVITIDKKGDLYLMETRIEKKDLLAKLVAITGEKKDSRIFVRGDKNISYGEVVAVVTEINSAGFNKVALISSQKQNDK